MQEDKETGPGYSCTCKASTFTMDVLSMIKHTLVADGTNPITKHFKLGKHVGSAGPESVWKIYEATRIGDDYVSTTNTLIKTPTSNKGCPIVFVVLCCNTVSVGPVN